MLVSLFVLRFVPSRSGLEEGWIAKIRLVYSRFGSYQLTEYCGRGSRESLSLKSTQGKGNLKVITA